jgi:hypothetical protein
VKVELQGVFNRGFWDGWKSALKKADVPSYSKMYLRDNTPLPYPEAGLKEFDDEGEDEEEDNDVEEAGTKQEDRAADSAHPTTDNPPIPTDGS